MSEKPGKGLFSLIWNESWQTSLTRWPGVVDRAQVQAFLLGYLSGQLGLLIVPDTLLRTWSQPAGTHNRQQCQRRTMMAASLRRSRHFLRFNTSAKGGGGWGVFHLNRYDVTYSWASGTRGRGRAHLPCSRACCRAA